MNEYCFVFVLLKHVYVRIRIFGGPQYRMKIRLCALARSKMVIFKCAQQLKHTFTHTNEHEFVLLSLSLSLNLSVSLC
jgi:hypothetical protein